MPRVSILMPTFNREESLKMILPSVFGQTYSDWKLILLDDGSTDDTEGLVKRCREPRISYHRQENVGVTVSRNRLLELCNTEYACWLDSDDKCNKYRLELLVKAMDKYNPPHIRTGQTFWRGDNDRMWQFPPTLLWHGGVCVASVMFRPSKAVEFNEDIKYGGEDMEWECRMQEFGGTPLEIPLALYVIGMRKGFGRLSKLHKNPELVDRAKDSVSLASRSIEASVERMKAKGKHKGSTRVEWSFISEFLGRAYG